MGLASLKIEGLQELYNKFEEVSKVINNKEVNQAFIDSAQIVLDAQKKYAPEDTGQGKEDLKIGKPKVYKGFKNIKIGLEYGNWTYGNTNGQHGARGIWYQHWGYTTRGGRFIQGSFWMDDAFDASKIKASTILINGINQAIDRAWQ